MKIITIAGTRPELIRLSVLIKKLDSLLGEDHTLVWTGQNYDPLLSDIFFEELGIRKPDYYDRGQSKTFATQIADMFSLVETAILEKRPDKALILGDTNSALTAILCERLGVKVYHMEAGNRCFDDRAPEEKNRKVIDSVSYMNLPYVKNSERNLTNEMKSGLVIGNPIYEVIQHYKDSLPEPKFEPKTYAVCTIHRSENVDDYTRLKSILDGLASIPMKIVLPLHPRTKSKIEQFGLVVPKNIQVINPLGFFDFLVLEKNARIAFTDSGTVQEECCIFGVPTVTIRDSTERPETIECGSNMLAPVGVADNITYAYECMNKKTEWVVPEGYLDSNVSAKVIELLIGVRHV